MRKNEKQIYKNARKNSNGYSFKPFVLIENKYIRYLIIFFLSFSLVISFLNITNILSWNRFLLLMGIVDGVERQNSNFAVYYLDAGQSDCSVIICDDEVMIIDSGTSNQYDDIYESLFTLEIKKIDYLVVTHQHDDHMEGASKLIEKYKTENVIMPKLSNINSVSSLTYNNLINNIAKYNVNPTSVFYGDSFKLGSAKVEILNPYKQDKNLNNMSIVLKITYGDTSFLFQGDAEENIEKNLLRSGIDISADVLKLGHHGSNTSSINTFLKKVNPQYAVISCGYDNNYGHPNTYTMQRLEENGIIPYITSLNGNIIATSNGHNVKIFAEKHYDD